MDELVKLVSERIGVSEDLARQAVEIVIGFLKQKLPAPLAGQIDNLLDGVDLDDLGDLAEGLGGLFDQK